MTAVESIIEQLREKFPTTAFRGVTSCGDQVLYVSGNVLHDVLDYLKASPALQFDYLVDITAVDYREAGRPLEVVYQLRSLPHGWDLRIKTELDKSGDLSVVSVFDLWRGADWMEREVFDMFGVTFRGHPDLRRILMWESYAEGYPLRKDFPLRGRFTRAEQTRQALGMAPEAHYSTEEIRLAGVNPVADESQ